MIEKADLLTMPAVMLTKADLLTMPAVMLASKHFFSSLPRLLLIIVLPSIYLYVSLYLPLLKNIGFLKRTDPR